MLHDVVTFHVTSTDELLRCLLFYMLNETCNIINILFKYYSKLLLCNVKNLPKKVGCACNTVSGL